MGAGKLDRRFRFERRNDQLDEYGNTVAGWVLQFTQAASLQYLRGGEGVLAARLEARQPAVLRIRASTQARQVTADWRAVDERTAQVFAIRENPHHPMRPDGKEDRAYLEFLCEAGVAE